MEYKDITLSELLVKEEVISQNKKQNILITGFKYTQRMHILDIVDACLKK